MEQWFLGIWSKPVQGGGTPIYPVLRSSHPVWEEKMCWLSELNGSDKNGDGEEWINTINHGGLCLVNDELFQTFLTMEELIVPQKCTFDTRKEAIIDKVMTDDYVLHLWSFCVPDAEQSISNTLLKKIVELYVKIRGFPFTSSCVELYKQTSKNNSIKEKSTK